MLGPTSVKSLLIHKHFSHDTLFKKIFNKNNIMVSYSWTRNIDQYIAQHNNVTLNKYLSNTNNNSSCDDQQCNCCKSSVCPMNGKCMYKEVIKVCIRHNDQIKSYFGSTANNWKKRFCHHKMTLNNKKYTNATALSKFYWGIKTYSYTPIINWEFIAKIMPFSGKGE